MFFGIIQKIETPEQLVARFNADAEDFENGWIEKHDILFSRLGLLIFLSGFVVLASLGHFQLGLLALIIGGWVCIAQIIKSEKVLAEIHPHPYPGYRRIPQLDSELFDLRPQAAANDLIVQKSLSARILAKH